MWLRGPSIFTRLETPNKELPGLGLAFVEALHNVGRASSLSKRTQVLRNVSGSGTSGRQQRGLQ
jgi:hypothetical protein